MDQPIESMTPWRLATKVAFRFCLLYFGLYVLCTQMISGLLTWGEGGVPALGTKPPVSSLTFWVIRHVFHDARPLQMQGGSGDKMFDWVQAFVLLCWPRRGTRVLVDRRSQARALLAASTSGSGVFVRFALGSTMIGYGS